jgi:excisionase family DNA binding protein
MTARDDLLPRYLTPHETADLLRTSRKAIYLMIERGQLPGVRRIGRRVLLCTREVLDWLDQKSAPSALEESRR